MQTIYVCEGLGGIPDSMNLLELFHCYPSKTYDCTESQFFDVVELFEEFGRSRDEEWVRFDKSPNKILFKKGKPVNFTFDYTDERIEVQAVFTFLPERSQLAIAVGNFGIIEPLILKKRFQRMLLSICATVEDSQIEVIPIDEANRA